MAEPFNNQLIADAISGAQPFISDFSQQGGTQGTGSASSALPGNPDPSVINAVEGFTGGVPSTGTPGTTPGSPLANTGPTANDGPPAGSAGGTTGANMGSVAPTVAPQGSGGVPSSSSLSPFGGGDVGSFVQWYNNLDPSMATSLFQALQKAQAPAPPAGVPQLTGPVPLTVG